MSLEDELRDIESNQRKRETDELRRKSANDALLVKLTAEFRAELREAETILEARQIELLPIFISSGGIYGSYQYSGRQGRFAGRGNSRGMILSQGELFLGYRATYNRPQKDVWGQRLATIDRRQAHSTGLSFGGNYLETGGKCTYFLGQDQLLSIKVGSTDDGMQINEAVHDYLLKHLSTH